MKKEKVTKIDKKNAKKAKKSGFLWFLGVSMICVALLVSCQFFFENALTGKERFLENTRINGINVGGMSVAEAENVVFADMLENKKDLQINLSCKDKNWTLHGSDFEVASRLQPTISQFSKFGHDGNFFENLKKKKQAKENGKDFVVSYSKILSTLDEEIDKIVAQVERDSVEASLIFNPNGEEVFEVDHGQSAILVNRDELKKQIDKALQNSNVATIEIPIIEIENNIDFEQLKNSVGLRGEFSTSYATSSNARKNNVKKALESFNGMIVESGQTVSFNETTGPRTEEQGYKSAHIIVGGVYVDGVGGGVCQASTTLYNALVLSDIEILSVSHHSLPASYVPLSFDAMVSGNYCDLVFKNTLDSPIYIKTFCDEQNVTVQIFGQKMDKTIKTRSELVKVLPHNGDKIVLDENEQYANKILFKGEYYRLKYPREGYESKGFLQYYQDGKLIEEKEIRHDFYQSQDGIVMEGCHTPGKDIQIPPSDVKIIKPQKMVQKDNKTVENKLKNSNPSQYNP